MGENRQPSTEAANARKSSIRASASARVELPLQSGFLQISSLLFELPPGLFLTRSGVLEQQFLSEGLRLILQALVDIGFATLVSREFVAHAFALAVQGLCQLPSFA